MNNIIIAIAMILNGPTIVDKPEAPTNVSELFVYTVKLYDSVVDYSRLRAARTVVLVDDDVDDAIERACRGEVYSVTEVVSVLPYINGEKIPVEIK